MNSRGIHYLPTLRPLALSFADSIPGHNKNQPTRALFFNYFFNYAARCSLRPSTRA
jgi:hypothetical protein